MMFDREAPGKGMEIYTKIENGKALLEFAFFVDEASSTERDRNMEDAWILLHLSDGNGTLVLELCHPLHSEELARGMLLHPHLWNSTEEPYLYKVEAQLLKKAGYRTENRTEGNQVMNPESTDRIEYRTDFAIESKSKSMERERLEVCDELHTVLALCTFQNIPGKGWFLNGSPFFPRAVGYELLPAERIIPQSGEEEARSRSVEHGTKQSEREYRRKCLEEDFQRLQETGANTIYLLKGNPEPEFYELCCEKGFAVWSSAGRGAVRTTVAAARSAKNAAGPAYAAGLPVLYGTGNGLFTRKDHLPTDTFYYYKAKWSKVPFVYLCRNSLTCSENGYYRVTAYSNQKKVALYVEGILFEFQTGEPEFIFMDISIKHFPVVLTAEAGNCSMSVTAYESYIS